ncbi:MAG: hypothetical protein MJ094_00895 [Saccharofermentans sp.]|nr:hypothetical protein [Saccharofermentans sp.]
MLPFPFDVSLFMFFIYSVVGWIVEVCYYGVTEGKFINRGFLFGPMCPVYGLGFYGVIWFFLPLMDNFPALFFGSAIICTAVELLAGVILYAIFHLRWWDYSEYKFNFKGFICLRFTIYWGIACSLGMHVLHPAVSAFINILPFYVRIALLAIMSALLLVDIILTVTAIIGFNKKVQFLSKMSGGFLKVSDNLGQKIYGTVDTIVTKTTPAVETTTNTYAEYKELYSSHRKEERELSKKHRAQERELIARYVNEGKQGITNTSKEALDKSKEALVRFRKLLPEIKLASRIRVSRNDADAESIWMLQAHYADMIGADSDEYIFEDE